MKFEKIQKKYALNNSYFKNKRPQDPQTPYEVFVYQEQHGELPYNIELEDGWIEECFAEYQKRNTNYKHLEQYFTPKETAKRIAQITDDYTRNDNVHVLDACCGYGSLSKELKEKGFIVSGFDIDNDLCKFYEENIESEALCINFEDYKEKQQIVVSNPPYTIKTLTSFLIWLRGILEEKGIAILLIPKNFIDKERPKSTVEAINNFRILYREDMGEEFSSTKIRAEIIVLETI